MIEWLSTRLEPEAAPEDGRYVTGCQVTARLTAKALTMALEVGISLPNDAMSHMLLAGLGSVFAATLIFASPHPPLAK